MQSISKAHLLILACSGTKRCDAGEIPAIHRYNGPLWQTLRTYRKPGVEVFFLSARYGLRHADEPVENYDARLSPKLAREMIATGLGDQWPDRRAQSARVPFQEIALVGGKHYIEVMKTYLLAAIMHDYVSRDHRITVINDHIGYMRQQLRRWLDGS